MHQSVKNNPVSFLWRLSNLSKLYLVAVCAVFTQPCPFDDVPSVCVTYLFSSYPQWCFSWMTENLILKQFLEKPPIYPFKALNPHHLLKYKLKKASQANSWHHESCVWENQKQKCPSVAHNQQQHTKWCTQAWGIWISTVTWKHCYHLACKGQKS